MRSRTSDVNSCSSDEHVAREAADAPILIVDRSAESREVIRTALERRGWKTIEADRAEAGLQLARNIRPRLIVVDLEDEAAGEPSLCQAYANESRRQAAELLIVGASRRAAASLAAEQIVPKPYHYAALIRKIEQLCRHVAAEEVTAPRSISAGRAA